MGLLHGAASYAKFRVIEPLPGKFKELLAERLPRHAFREIDPRKQQEVSIGWVNPLNPLDAALTVEKSLYGRYLILGMRRDKKAVPMALLKARVTEALRARGRQLKGKKLSREQVQEVRDTVKADMLAAVSPATALTEMVWDYEKQEVYYSSGSRQALTEFADLFGETFDMTLEEQSLATRTEAFMVEKDINLELADLEPAHFN